VAQGIGPEFKPQYHQKKKRELIIIKFLLNTVYFAQSLWFLIDNNHCEKMRENKTDWSFCILGSFYRKLNFSLKSTKLQDGGQDSAFDSCLFESLLK
jgi:hypothetical protein